MPTHDPAKYRMMSMPFQSPEAAKEAIGKFWDAVADARDATFMTDVHVIVRINVLSEAGEEGTMITAAHFGSSIEAETMCAWALGQEMALRESTIGKMLKGWGR